MSNFFGFDGKKDIAYEFEITEAELEDIDIIIASYATPPYEGHAFVLFEKDGKLYEVNGSHCSCSGLEGQWSPEETTKEALQLRNGSGYSRILYEADGDAIKLLEEWLSGKAPDC